MEVAANTKTCLQCNGVCVRRSHGETNEKWSKRKFCSNQCRYAGSVGHKTSPETRAKIGAANSGRVMSPEVVEANRVKGIGKKHSEETKQKIRANAAWGEKNRHWRGGITPIYRKIRALPEMKYWKMHVLQRDDYTCQGCRVRGVSLHVDHIIPFHFIIVSSGIGSVEQAIECEFLWDIRNGRALCVPCHKKTPTYLKKTYVA